VDVDVTGRQVRDLVDNGFIKVSAKRGCWSCVVQLYVKLLPLRAGTGEPAGEPRLLCCPPDVEPDAVLSFLTQQLGEVIDTAWTFIDGHTRVAIGWVFPGAPAAGPREAVELACVPFIKSPGGSLQPMYRAHASQHRQAAQLTDSHGLDTTLLQRPHRTYHPSARPTDRDTSTPKATQTAGPAGELDHLLAAIARHTGATLRIYPRPGHAAPQAPSPRRPPGSTSPFCTAARSAPVGRPT
jgi:hypothetical protein